MATCFIELQLMDLWCDRRDELERWIKRRLSDDARILMVVPSAEDQVPNDRAPYMGQIMAECDCSTRPQCQASGRCEAKARFVKVVPAMPAPRSTL